MRLRVFPSHGGRRERKKCPVRIAPVGSFMRYSGYGAGVVWQQHALFSTVFWLGAEWIEKCQTKIIRPIATERGATIMRKMVLAVFMAFVFVVPEPADAVELKPRTAEAFNRYVRATEDRMAEELRGGRGFL